MQNYMACAAAAFSSQVQEDLLVKKVHNIRISARLHNQEQQTQTAVGVTNSTRQAVALQSLRLTYLIERLQGQVCNSQA
jgi:hypothetical protein